VHKTSISPQTSGQSGQSNDTGPLDTFDYCPAVFTTEQVARYFSIQITVSCICARNVTKLSTDFFARYTAIFGLKI